MNDGFWLHDFLRFETKDNIKTCKKYLGFSIIFYREKRVTSGPTDYNALNELISEKGERERTYSYDSLGNRLKLDRFSYKINDLNQVLEAEGEVSNFDPAGNLETKTSLEKTWNFQTSPLGHLISVQDPNQITIAYTYDLNGKRLSKKVEAKGKKTKIYRYFYLGQTELGCLDEKGNIVELKVPMSPNDPELSPCVAIEIKKETYAPLYDNQGNIACLIDPERRVVVESYRYSAFGEEEIFNQRGKKITDSALGNPWRYKAKRIDQETGLIYFGKRYYSPKIGRWISPDPIGSIDGPNLYRFCRNNPLKFVDYFGLASETGGDEFSKYFYGEYEPYCHCEQHRDCKRGGDVGRSLGIMDLLSNPRFQGSMQAFSGLVEAGIGGGMTFGSGAIAAPLGWPVMAHGLDQFFTGMSAVFTGRLEDSVTSQLLQETGLSSYAAGLIDNSLSIAGSMGGIASIHAGQLAALPNFRLPTTLTTVAELSPNPLLGTKYSQKVLLQMKNNLRTGKPDFHGFPQIVDNYATFGQKELIKGRDGITRVKISLEGSYKGQDGYFEWIIESNKSVNHRIFIPNP